MKRLINYSVRPTSQAEIDANMPYVTASMVEAINTCPKWGIIHNVQGKRFVTGFRQMALEAGSVMHDVFAAFNLWNVAAKADLPEHAQFHGEELFGKDRFAALEFTSIVSDSRGDVDHNVLLDKLAYATIGTSDFYDDPMDKNRTVANLEHAAAELAFYYLMNHVAFPIYVADLLDPTAPIGVEQSLDVVFELVFDDDTSRLLRFIGLADAVYQNRDTKLVTLGEYKTASSMNDAWRESFKTRHQITGYVGALDAYYEHVSFKTILTGSAIPVRRTTAPVAHFPVTRDRENVIDFLRTAIFALEMRERYSGAAVLTAPMFTHSCNRYFRPCALLDLCASAHVDQQIMWEQMEVTDELSPSEMKALLRQQG